MKKIELSNKTYLLAFVFTMLLNVFLAAFLFDKVTAQISDKKLKRQPPIATNVLEQVDNPLLITVINAENSDSLFQVANCSVQNVYNKSILTYTVVGKTKKSGRVFSRYFLAKPFQPNQFNSDEIAIERQNITVRDTLSISVDYVLFDDGSSWGEDAEKESERFAGNFAGRKTAVKEITNLLDSQKIDAIAEILKQEITTISTPSPNSKQSDKWLTGFRQGYKAVLAQLKFAYEKQGIDAIASSIRELKSIVEMEEK